MKRTHIMNYVPLIVLLVLAAAPAAAKMDITQTLSDEAQRNTIAFDGFAMVTGTFEAQTFFPPGKLADYWGFQYLRDNTADGNGHNTSFLTNCAFNVLYILSADQFAMLKTLATSQVDQINLYGYKRYPLMKAFHRQLDGDIPTGSTGLSLDAVKAASADLYKLDGQISFDRAVVYAALFNTLTASQKSHLEAMKTGGFDSWTVTTEMENTVRELMKGVSHDVSVALMTYAGDLFSWYAGSIEADVYFCPERQGTYFGSFYVKDAPAIGHEGYKIDESLTANAGKYFLEQLALTQLDGTLTALVDKQRSNLYAGTQNIVQIRTDISTLLRSLVSATAPTESFKAQVLAQVLEKSQIYGELDGEIVYDYTMAFSEVFPVLTTTQSENLMAMRKKILSGVYNGVPFDYTVCTTPFLFSAIIEDLTVLIPYIANTDYLFGITATGVLSVSPATRDVTKDAGTTSFSVANTGTGTLSWTASVTSGDGWLSITSGASGTNAGTIQCSISANTGTSARTGTIRVTATNAAGSPKDVTVTQAAPTVRPVISGTVRTGTGTAIPGVTITFSNGGGTAATGGDGSYSITVPYNYSGTAVPSKTGYTFSPTSKTYTVVTADQTDQHFIGTVVSSSSRRQIWGVWEDGVWSWNKAANTWNRMASTANAMQIAAGKVDADDVDDLIGVWASGLYVRSSTTGKWLRLSGVVPVWITVGDLNDDGLDDIIGSWKDDGTYYRNSATGQWVKLTTPAKQLTVGKIAGERDDLVGVWDGLWIRHSDTAAWQKIDAAMPFWITAGDMTGDNLPDIVGSYNSGIWYRNSATGVWTRKTTTPAQQLSAGDIDGDGRDDLIGVWSSGVWVCDGVTGQWERIGTSRPRWITTGKLAEAVQAADSLTNPPETGENVTDLPGEGPGSQRTE